MFLVLVVIGGVVIEKCLRGLIGLLDQPNLVPRTVGQLYPNTVAVEAIL